MEADARYYWRRAVEELGAARRSLSPEARDRHHHFSRLYLERLTSLGAPLPFSLAKLDAETMGVTTPGQVAA